MRKEGLHWCKLSFEDIDTSHTLLLQELRGNIRVHCRVRPVLDFDRGTAECIICTDDVSQLDMRMSVVMFLHQ